MNPAQNQVRPPLDPTAALCLGTYGDPRGVGVSYGRGTPVLNNCMEIRTLKPEPNQVRG